MTPQEIKSIRERCERLKGNHICCSKLEMQAYIGINALLAEVERLIASDSDKERYTIELYGRAKTAEAEVNRLTKERDAAVGDLRVYGNCHVCVNCNKDIYPLKGYCKFGGCRGGGNGVVQEDKWEWRGLEDKQ